MNLNQGVFIVDVSNWESLKNIYPVLHQRQAHPLSKKQCVVATPDVIKTFFQIRLQVRAS